MCCQVKVWPPLPSAAACKRQGQFSYSDALVLAYLCLHHQDQIHYVAQERCRAHCPNFYSQWGKRERTMSPTLMIPGPALLTTSGIKGPESRRHHPCHLPPEERRVQLSHVPALGVSSSAPLPPGSTLLCCTNEVQGLPSCVLLQLGPDLCRG